MAVAELTAILTAEAQQFNRNVMAAEKTFRSSARSIQTEATRTANAMDRLTVFAGRAMKAAVGIGLGTALLKGAGNLRTMAKSAVMGAGRIEQMNDVLEVLGRTSGWTTEEINKQVQAIRDSGIEYGIAQRTLQEFIRYNLDVARSHELARVAQDAAVLSNSNSSATLDRLILGISRQNSLILRTAGLTVQVGQAIDKYASAQGRAAASLTASERTQAVFNAVLEEGTRIQGAYVTSLDNPIKKLGSLKRVQDDVANNLGKTFFPVLVSVVNNGLDPFWKWLSKSTEEGTALNSALSRLGTRVAETSDAFIEFLSTEGGEALASMAESAAAVAQAFGAFGKVLTDAETMAVAFNVAAGAMEALAKAAKILSPLLQGFVVLKLAKALGVYSVASRVAAGATFDLMVAMNGLAAAIAKVLPLLAAYAAFEVASAFIGAFANETFNADRHLRNLDEALGDGAVSVQAFTDEMERLIRLGDAGENPFAQPQLNSWLDRLGSDLPVVGGIFSSDSTVLDTLKGMAAPARKAESQLVSLAASATVNNDAFTDLEETLMAVAEAYASIKPNAQDMTPEQFEEMTLRIYENNDAIQAVLGSVNELREANAVFAKADITSIIEGDKAFAAAEGYAALNLEAERLNRGLEGTTVTGTGFQQWLDSLDPGQAIVAFADLRAAQQQYILEQEQLAEDGAEFEQRVRDLGDRDLALLEQRLQSTAQGFKNLGDKISLTAGAANKAIAVVNRTTAANEAWRAVLDQVADGSISLEQAQAALGQQMSGLVDDALANAQALAEMAGVEADTEEATRIFKEELERTIGPLLAAADALDIETEALRRLRDMLAGIDGSVSNAVLQMTVQFQGDLQRVQEAIALMERMNVLGAMDEQLATLRAVAALIGGTSGGGLSSGGVSSGGGGGGGGSGPAEEPRWGGHTADEWRQIGEEIERVNNHAREQADEFQRGVGIIMGAIRAQKGLNDLRQAAVDLQTERNQLTQTDIALQESLVATLAEEAAAITATEALAIERASNEVAALGRRVRAGLSTETELKAAEERLSEAQAAAVGPTAELEQAEADLLAMKERVAEIDKELTENAWSQVEAQAELAVRLSEVAGNFELVQAAIGNLDFSQIPGADDLLAAIGNTGQSAAAFNALNLAGLTRGQAFQQIAASLGQAGLSQQAAFDFLAGKGIVGVGSTARLGETFTAEQAGLVQGRIQNSTSITVYAGLGTDPVTLGEAIAEALIAFESVNGPIPITVSGSTGAVS